MLSGTDWILIIVSIIIIGGVGAYAVFSTQSTSVSSLTLPTGASFSTPYNEAVTIQTDGRYVAPEDKTTLLNPVSNNVSSSSWSNLSNFPNGCPNGEAVQVIGSSLTCVPLGSGSNDSRIGELVNGKWCDYNGTNINCTQNTPSGSGTNYTDVNTLSVINSLDLNNSLSYSKIDTNCAVSGSCSNVIYWVDANIVFVKQTDGNNWYVLKNDFNTLGDQRYYLKTNPDGYITSAGLSNYLLKVDANNLYAFKSDVNTWGDLRYYSITNPSNFISISALTAYITIAQADANYAKKSDVNAWGDVRYYPLNSNPAGYLTTSVDTNCSVYGSCPLVLYQSDANAWFVLKSDLNNLGDARWIKLTDFNTLGDARYSLLGHNHNAIYYLKSEVDANFGNYYTRSQSDANWNKFVLTTDFNSRLSPQTCPVGQALRSLGSTPVCVSVTSSVDTNCAVTHSCANVIYSGDNISLLVNNSGFITIAQADANYLPKGNYITVAQADANYQVKGNYITVSQADSNYWAKTNNFITVAQADNNYYGKSVTYTRTEIDNNFANYYTKAQSDVNWNKYVKITDFNSNLVPQQCPAGQALRILGATPTCISVGGSGTDTNESTAGRVNANGVRLLDFNFGLKNLYNVNDVNAQRFCFNNGTCTTSWATGGFSNPATSDLNMNLHGINNVVDLNGSNIYGVFSTVKDGSPFNRDGNITVINYGEVDQVIGKINQGASFNVNEAHIEQNQDFNNSFVTSAYTLSAWIKTTSNTTNHTFIGATGGSSSTVTLIYNWSNVGATGQISFVHITSGPTLTSVISARDVNDGAWHLITGTFDGTRMHLYIDGVEDGNTISSSPISLGTTHWKSGGPEFAVQIDDVGVWSRALTSGQVSALWNSGAGSAISNSDINLQFVYHLDDATKARINFPTGINPFDINTSLIRAVYVIADNVCYSDGTNCTGVNPFDQSLNSGDSPNFNDLYLGTGTQFDTGDVYAGNIFYASNNTSVVAGITDCYDSALGGQVCSTGGIVSSITDDPSDANFKIDVKNLSLDLNKFNSVVPSEWTWSPTSAISKSGEGYGFVAQELMKIYPQLVKDGQKKQLTGYSNVVDVNGVLRKTPIWSTLTYKTIDYAGVIALQVKQIQDLKTRIVQLELDNNALKNNFTDLQNCAVASKIYEDYQKCVGALN